MTELRIVADGVVELDGIPVARLLANLTLSLRDKLEEAFDELAEDGRPQNLAARMRRARMRLVAQGPDTAIISPKEPRP